MEQKQTNNPTKPTPQREQLEERRSMPKLPSSKPATKPPEKK